VAPSIAMDRRSDRHPCRMPLQPLHQQQCSSALAVAQKQQKQTLPTNAIQTTAKIDVKQRRTLECQRIMINGLLGYSTAITSAFELLTETRASLEAEGFCQFDDSCGSVGLSQMFESLCDAHWKSDQMAKAAHKSLEAFASRLSTTADCLREADAAEAAVNHYRTQLEACKVKHTASWRAATIQTKLDPAVEVAGAAMVRVQDALQGCEVQQTELRHLICNLSLGTAQVLLSAIGPRCLLPEIVMPVMQDQSPASTRADLDSAAVVAEVFEPSTPSSSLDASVATAELSERSHSTIQAFDCWVSLEGLHEGSIGLCKGIPSHSNKSSSCGNENIAFNISV